MAAFKANYFTVINGKTLVMRFRRVGQSEKQAGWKEESEVPATPAKQQAKKEAVTPAKQQQTPQVKKEAATPVSAKKGAATPTKPALKVETPAKKLPVAKRIEEEDDDEDEEDDDDEEDENGLGALEIDEDDDEEDDDDEDVSRPSDKFSFLGFLAVNHK